MKTKLINIALEKHNIRCILYCQDNGLMTDTKEPNPVASIQFGTAAVNIYESASVDFITKLFEAASHVK